MPGYAPGSYQIFITILTNIFHSSKSVYIIHEGYSQNTEQLIRLVFVASNAVIF